MDWVLFALIAIPLGSVPVFMLIPSRYPQVVRSYAAASGLAMFALSVLTFVRYEFEGGRGLRFDLRLDWLENVAFLKENGITLHLAVDGISAPMVLLTGIVIFAGVFVSWNISYRNKDYFALLFLLLSAVWGASSDFGTFKRTKEYGAMKLMLYLVAGSVLIFIAMLAPFVEADKGTFDLTVLGSVAYDENFQKTFFPFFMIGFGVLAGLWPFHTWSPDGHVAAPTAVSMLHAGVLMKLGAFGILRVGMTLMPEGAEFWAPALMALGVTGALYGAISALAQKDLKYMVGYSSVSHMGYVLMG